MKPHALLLVAAVASILAGCQSNEPSLPDAAASQKIQAAVRLLADSISHDVTQEGPNAWLRYFERTPHFFMASTGNLMFPDYDSAARFVPRYSAGMRRIKLTWSDVRIDPLSTRLASMGATFREVITDSTEHQLQTEGYFTAVAEETPSGWRLRNAHWSMGEHVQ
jgi:hypothetical protein